jgi:hypothetical protein
VKYVLISTYQIKRFVFNIYYPEGGFLIMNTNIADISEKDVKIARGVVIRVWNNKRSITAYVRLSKKRTAELNALKTSAFYQKLTLVETRRDVTVFRTTLSSFADRPAFIKEATEAANAVGVGLDQVMTVKSSRVLGNSKTLDV